MFNAELPPISQLPTSGQLVRSTLVALASATALLFTVVLPAEYGIDPTGAGKVLGLTEMGLMKSRLAREAEKDRLRAVAAKAHQSEGAGTAQAAARTETKAPAARSDKITLTLKPDEGVEVKMQMKQGAKANFSWSVSGGTVHFDEHGEGLNNEISYAKANEVANREGTIEAAFDGLHGWYWRNRGTTDVTITLTTQGTYAAIARM